MPIKKIKRAFRGARKQVKKLIPKEVRAVAPFVAAYYGGPALAGKFGTSGIFANEAFRSALAKGLVAGGTQFATDDEADLKDIARAGVLAAAPDAIAGGSEALATKLDPRSLSYVNPNMEVGKLAADTAKGLRSIQKGVEGAGALKTIGAQSAIEGVERLKEIEQDELDRYNRELQDRGIRGKAERRTAIRNIYLGIGYDEDYVDSMLDRFGYKGGGITMTDEQFATLLSSLRDDEDKDEMSISEYTDMANKGFQQAYGMESLFDQAPKPMPIRPGFDKGGDIMSPEEYFKEKEKFKKRKSMDDMMEEYEDYMYKQKYGPRDSAAEGGLMNLGGKEMDLRGGGFVPIGKKEKADDVPARLSKNEFVMTADAVRGAGGGDVNKGAKRMYQTMDELEAMA